MKITTDILEKLDAGLQRTLSDTEGAATTVFPIVISLHAEKPAVPAGLTKAAHAAFLKTRFEEEARPLIDRLIQLGAQAIQPLWIGRAISARSSGTAILEIARDSAVKQVTLDVPRKLI